MSITQKLSKRGAILAASLVLGAAFTASSLSAQSVSTAPVGAVTKTINVGLNSVGITLLNPDLVVASASANTATSITLTGVTNVGALLTAGLPFYVEAVSGPLEGERFDVDTAATIASANGIVTLATSANNTFALAADNAVGTQFALRKHVNLAQVQSFFTTPLVGSNTAGSADQIWILNAAGTAFAQYYLRADLTTWRLTTGATNVANTVIVPPGTGIIIQKRTAAATLVSTGGVRVNDFAMPLAVGLSFRAPAYPINFTPASLGGTVANGWTGNNTSGSADQLRVLNAAGSAFNAYYLRADGTSWRLTTGATNVATTELFSYDSGFMVSRKSADTNYILNSPITL